MVLVNGKKVWNSGYLIQLADVDKVVFIYNGKKFSQVFITDKKVGHYLGEFRLTKKIGGWIHKQKDKKKRKK